MNSLLLPGDWLIQPEALRSMALAVRAFNERGNPLPPPRPQSALLTVEGGIGSVSMEGPILRKPDLFARVLMGATGSYEFKVAQKALMPFTANLMPVTSFSTNFGPQ